MNIVAISGKIIDGPELKHTATGATICSFTVDVRRPGVKDTTDAVDCVAWEKKAEFVNRFFRRGSMIEVSGVVVTREATVDGVWCKITEVRADNVSFMDRGFQNGKKGKRKNDAK